MESNIPSYSDGDTSSGVPSFYSCLSREYVDKVLEIKNRRVRIMAAKKKTTFQVVGMFGVVGGFLQIDSQGPIQITLGMTAFRIQHGVNQVTEIPYERAWRIVTQMNPDPQHQSDSVSIHSVRTGSSLLVVAIRFLSFTDARLFETAFFDAHNSQFPRGSSDSSGHGSLWPEMRTTHKNKEFK